jgi:DNA-binding LacI/PurR family transcriptional regulator
MRKLAFRAGEKPRREKLYRDLRESLRRGEFHPGDKFYSDRALMRSRSLSLVTVRAALDRLVEEGLLERHRGSGTYVTNLMPVVLGLRIESPAERTTPSRKATPNRLRIGFAPQVRGLTPTVVEFYRALFERAEQGGHLIQVLPRWDGSKSLDAYLESLEIRFLDAVIWSAPQAGSLPALRRFKEHGLPLVVVRSHFLEESFHEISTDYTQGIYLATSHLLRAGHERVALVIGIAAHRTIEQGERGFELSFQECRHGYTRALLSEGLTPHDGLILEQDYGRTPNLVLPFLERVQPSAVIFSTSSMLMKYLNSDGLKRWPVPAKLSIITNDNKLPMIRERWPETAGWTWLHEPSDVLGRMAVEKAIRLCRQSEPTTRTLVPMTLVEGNSVAKFR